MPITTLKVLASLLQLHGPGATVQSDHQGINALLADLRDRNPEVTQVAFRKGAFVKGAGAGAFRKAAAVAPVGAFRKAAAVVPGAFRKGALVRAS
jgi:hypothetical protein